MPCNARFMVYTTILIITSTPDILAKSFNTLGFPPKRIARGTSYPPKHTLNLPGEDFDVERAKGMLEEMPFKKSQSTVSILNTSEYHYV